MSLVQLPRILGLRAIGVEDGVEKTGVGGLQPLINIEVSKKMVFLAKFLVNASGHQPLVGEIARMAAELDGSYRGQVRLSAEGIAFA